MEFSNRQIDVLLVEDNEGDVRLIREAFSESSTENRFIVVNDGEAALDYLHKRGKFESSTRPDIIVLDLNLPKIDGFDVLTDVKSHPDLNKIPVIIFSSSTADSDIIRSYDLRANSYVSKPTDFNDFLGVVKTIEEFWFQSVKLPLN